MALGTNVRLLQKKKIVVSESPPPAPPSAVNAHAPSLFSDDDDEENTNPRLPPTAPAVSASTTIAPPPPPPRPIVVDQSTKDPPQTFKTKVIQVQPPQAPSTGIDTKKRLWRDALQPVAPQKKAPGTSRPQPDRIITGSSTVMSTGFRSTIQTPVAPRPRDQEQTLASLNSRETPPPTSAGPGYFSEIPQPAGTSSLELASKEDPFHISPSHEYVRRCFDLLWDIDVFGLEQ
jgi:hypothetical protein